MHDIITENISPYMMQNNFIENVIQYRHVSELNDFNRDIENKEKWVTLWEGKRRVSLDYAGLRAYYRISTSLVIIIGFMIR